MLKLLVCALAAGVVVAEDVQVSTNKKIYRTVLLNIFIMITLWRIFQVSTNKGPVRGARIDSDFGQYYYAFKGIPYAQPPVKHLRYLSPHIIVIAQHLMRILIGEIWYPKTSRIINSLIRL